MFDANKRERVAQEFLELTRKFPQLSEPVYEKAIACIEECLNQVRRVHQQPVTRDNLTSKPSKDASDTDGCLSTASDRTQCVVSTDPSLHSPSGKNSDNWTMGTILVNLS